MSNIIKNSGGTGGGVERFEMGEIDADSQETLATARDQADAIVQRARQEAENLRDQAFQQGWEAGRREARESAEAEARAELSKQYGERAEQMMTTLKELTSMLEAKREPVVKMTRNDLLKLAMRIAEMVVKKEMEVPGEVAALNLEECIRRSARRTELVALVNEQDIETLRLVLPRMEEAAGTNSVIKLVASPEVTPGGCIVRSQSGEVDGRIETQMGEIERVLVGEGQTAAMGNDQ